jgi:transposase-like protein
MAETRADANRAFELFVATYEAKYPKAVECLAKDRTQLLAFYDFPAEHWIHLRTSNVIESSFATVRHRTDRTKGCLTRDGMLGMIFKLGMSAEKSWRRLRGFEHLAKVIEGVKFRDGIEVPMIERTCTSTNQQGRRLINSHTPELTIALDALG